MTQQPSGWYDDPSDPEALRYWDGVVWTSHSAPRKSPTAAHSTIGLSQQAAPGQAAPSTTTLPPSGWEAQSGPQYPYEQYQQYQQYQQSAGWPALGPTTTDGVPLASWGKRLIAWILDSLLVYVVANLVTPLVLSDYDAKVEAFSDEVAQAIVNGDQAALGDSLVDILGISLQAALIAFLVGSAYTIAFWTTTAQTPGKMAAGISVRHTDRPGPLTLGTALKRRVVELLAVFVPFLSLLDGLWPLWDGNRQALHDKVASTQVVVGKQPRKQS